MRALVTGSTGFIGSHVVQELRKQRISSIVGLSGKQGSLVYQTLHPGELDIWKCNITKEAWVQEVLAAAQPDIIFHLAGNPLVKDGSPEVTRTNVLGTHNLLMYAPQGCRFVLASSATVYGNSLNCTEESRLQPNSVYGASKVAAETLVEVYDWQGKVSGLSLRYVANCGYGSTHGVVHDLLRKLYSDSETLDLIGDCPGSAKPYAHVAETAHSTVLCGLDPQIRGSLNLSPDDTLTVEELAELIMETCGVRKPLRWLGEKVNWVGDNRYVSVCSDKAKRYGMSFMSSREAVSQAVKDFAT